MGNEMRLDTSQSQPSLLMLSDCFPDPDGASRAARAWRLLCCAASTHQVYLSADAGRPVNLDQWRRVADLARRVHLESRRPRLFRPSRIHQGAGVWARQRRFDVLLVTSSRVWPGIGLVDAGLRLCDFSQDKDRAGQGIVEQAGLLRRLVWPTLGRSSSRVEGAMKVSEVIAECDHPLVALAEQVSGLPAGQSRAVTVQESGPMDSWAQLFQEGQTLSEFVAPEVTVMPIHPVPSRKAA